MSECTCHISPPCDYCVSKTECRLCGDIFHPDGGHKCIQIRTLGFYQPFGSLMIHDKIETRWIREGRKPPFPLGKYLFYSTKTPVPKETLYDWCGKERAIEIMEKVLNNEVTLDKFGYALAIGTLHKIELLKPEEEEEAFVKYIGTKTESVKKKNGTEELVTKVQWGLHFKDVQRIEPFVWKFGKQGIGFVPESEYEKIKI